MTITNLVFITRKPDLPFDDFVKYFEETHTPMIRKLLGDDAMPKEFRRLYVDSSKPAYIGPPRGIDLVLEMVFEDEAQIGRFMGRLGEGDNAKILQESWKNYADEKGETIVGTGATFGF